METDFGTYNCQCSRIMFKIFQSKHLHNYNRLPLPPKFYSSLYYCFPFRFSSLYKKKILLPERRNGFFFFLLIILPFLLDAGGLYILQKIDIGDPEYFYEFGISSIADYPIYLIWNFPQMILLFFFLVTVSSISKFRFITVAVVIFFLFAFEFVSIDKTIIPFWELGVLISCSIIYSILINYYRNIYWFGISLFTLLWLAILAFGSSSKTMINLLFASQYSNWEGFFEVVKDYMPFTLPVYFGIALIISCIACLLFSKDNSVSGNHKRKYNKNEF